MISSARAFATWRSASRSVCTYCFMVKGNIRVADPLAERLPVGFCIPTSGRVAAPDVVQVDLGQPGRRRQPLEPAGDRVRVRRLAVLLAEQHAVIVVIRPGVAPFAVQHLDVHPENGEGERVERQDVLRVLGLAVRLNDLAVHHDAGRVDGEHPGRQVEQITASARQLAASHARGGFEHPQREEPVRPGPLQKRLELGDKAAPLRGTAGASVPGSALGRPSGTGAPRRPERTCSARDIASSSNV